jgi:hypothetical protein
LAFLFADLIVLPIVAIYRKYYGTRYAVRIVALMFVTMVSPGERDGPRLMVRLPLSRMPTGQRAPTGS